MKEIDITIIQKPVLAEYTCPHCDTVISIPYKDFIIFYSEPCEWIGTIIRCENCEKESQINDWEFD